MSMNFVLVVLLSLAMPVFSQTLPTGGNFHFEPKQRKLFSLWEENSEVLVAAEMLIGEYPDQTLMSKIINSEKELDLSIPENLIINEHNLTQKADLKAILNNYYDHDDKEFARQLYHNIQHSQDWILKHIKDIEFRTKAVFGNLIRIKCKQIENDQKAIAISWNTLSKQYGKRYFFVAKKEENELFSILSEAYPYWEPKRIYHSEDKIQGLSKFSILPSSSNPAQAEASKIEIYLNIKKFDDTKNATFKKEVQDLITKCRSFYIENNKDKLLELYHPQNHEEVQSSLFDRKDIYKSWQTYFQGSDGITADFYIGTPDVCFVFVRQLVKGKPESEIRILKFIRDSGKLYLTDSMSPLYYEENTQLFLTEEALEHPTLKGFYHQIVQKKK